MNNTRQRIYNHITVHPGIHFNAIVRTLDLAPGQVQYHVQELLSDKIELERLYGRTHYYPRGYTQWEHGVLALFRRETAREILLYLLKHEPTTPATVTTDLNIARSTLEWHLDHFITTEIVEKQRNSKNRVILTLIHSDQTRELLQDIQPSTSDRFVDRFMRLTDNIFETIEE
jgi:predicted transcriptional regulator